MEHLVYCDAKSKELKKLFDGTKTMLIRGAAGRKCPYGKVSVGETLYFVENTGDGKLKAKAKVSSVYNSEKMLEEESIDFVNSKQAMLNLSSAQLKRFAGKKYVCLIGVSDIEKMEEQMTFNNANNMADWIIVDKIADIIV